MNTTTTEAIKSHVVDELKALTLWEIASSVDTGLTHVNTPDGSISDGANYLDTVRVVVAEFVRDYEGELEDLPDAIRDDAFSFADYSLPVYTVDVFQTMLDLFAYRQEIDEYVTGELGLEDMAKLSIFVIGEREARNFADLVQELIENYEG